MRQIQIIGAFLFILPLIGCGLRNGPSQTVQNFLEAASHQETSVMKEQLTTAAQKNFSMVSQVMPGMFTYDIHQSKVENGSATVRAALHPTGQKDIGVQFELKRERGDWRIYGINYPNNHISINFEDHSFGGGMLGNIMDLLSSDSKRFTGAAEGMANNSKIKAAAVGKIVGNSINGFEQGLTQGLNGKSHSPGGNH